jgi:hypothetical protein
VKIVFEREKLFRFDFHAKNHVRKLKYHEGDGCGLVDDHNASIKREKRRLLVFV